MRTVCALMVHCKELKNVKSEKGVSTPDNQAYGCYSIDVPSECPIGDVDACLAKLDPSLVAIAYPSFRHQDGAAPPAAKADV